MTTMLERLADMPEEQLDNLLANAIRLSDSGPNATRKAAAELRPAIEAELASRKTIKLEKARTVRQETTKVRKSRAKPRAAAGEEPAGLDEMG
jgi:nucleoid-associated protein YgaU